MKIFWIQVVILFAAAMFSTAFCAESYDIQDDYSVALQPWTGYYDEMVLDWRTRFHERFLKTIER